MNRIIKEAIEQSWVDLNEDIPSYFMNSPSVCKKSHDRGWKEGYEWILTELAINKKISQDTLKEYMEAL